MIISFVARPLWGKIHRIKSGSEPERLDLVINIAKFEHGHEDLRARI